MNGITTFDEQLKLTDRERTAFGLGWEFRRRGLPIESNPFPLEHWKFDDFCAGWREFTPSSLECGK